MSKPWYKKWWGFIVVVLLFYIFIPYYAWFKSSWSTNKKILVTVACILFVGFAMLNSSAKENQRKEKIKSDQTYALELVEKAEDSIKNDLIKEARDYLVESTSLYKDETENKAFVLLSELDSYESEDYLKTTLMDLPNEKISELEAGTLTISLFSNPDLNNLFLIKLKNALQYLPQWRAEAEEKLRIAAEEEAREATEQAAAERQRNIEAQFDAWDGNHRNLEELIKSSMNNPDSYKHVETIYWDQGDHLLVLTTFRGENAFGGTITNTVKAKVGLDGTILEIIEQY